MDPTLLALLPPTLLRWAPPLRQVRYDRVGTAGGFDLPRASHEERWEAPTQVGEAVHIRRRTHDLADAKSPRLVEDAMISYGADGLCDLGTFGADGLLSAWDPPSVVLPASPAPGLSWLAAHQRATTVTERSVELQSCTEHAHCLVSVAQTRRTDGLLILRTHFGDGAGFQGWEALVQSPGQPVVRLWTEAVTTSR